jgi:hypothetical protein
MDGAAVEGETATAMQEMAVGTRKRGVLFGRAGLIALLQIQNSLSRSC